MVENVLFLDHIFGSYIIFGFVVVEFFKELHGLRAPESKNHIFEGWFVYLSLSSIIKKITAGTSKLVSTFVTYVDAI